MMKQKRVVSVSSLSNVSGFLFGCSFYIYLMLYQNRVEGMVCVRTSRCREVRRKRRFPGLW